MCAIVCLCSVQGDIWSFCWNASRFLMKWRAWMWLLLQDYFCTLVSHVGINYCLLLTLLLGLSTARIVGAVPTNVSTDGTNGYEEERQYTGLLFDLDSGVASNGVAVAWQFCYFIHPEYTDYEAAFALYRLCNRGFCLVNGSYRLFRVNSRQSGYHCHTITLEPFPVLEGDVVAACISPPTEQARYSPLDIFETADSHLIYQIYTVGCRTKDITSASFNLFLLTPLHLSYNLYLEVVANSSIVSATVTSSVSEIGWQTLTSNSLELQPTPTETETQQNESNGSFETSLIGPQITSQENPRGSVHNRMTSQGGLAGNTSSQQTTAESKDSHSELLTPFIALSSSLLAVILCMSLCACVLVLFFISRRKRRRRGGLTVRQSQGSVSSSCACAVWVMV